MGKTAETLEKGLIFQLQNVLFFLFYVKVQSLTLRVYEEEPENITGIHIIVRQLRVVL